ADRADLQCLVELDRRPVFVRPEAIITRSQRIQQGADLRRRGSDPSLVNIVHSHASRSPERHARCGSAQQAEQHNGASHNPVHGRFNAGGNVILIGTVPTRASFVLNVSGRPGTMGRINSTLWRLMPLPQRDFSNAVRLIGPGPALASCVRMYVTRSTLGRP